MKPPQRKKRMRTPASRTPTPLSRGGGKGRRQRQVALAQAGQPALPRIALVEGLRCVGPTLTGHELLRLKEQVQAWERSEGFQRGFKELALLSGRVRLLVLWLLARQPLCVCDLAEILGDSVSNLSHQLKSLRQAGWVAGRRVGKAIEYALTPEGERILALLAPFFYASAGIPARRVGELHPFPSPQDHSVRKGVRR